MRHASAVLARRMCWAYDRVGDVWWRDRRGRLREGLVVGEGDGVGEDVS